MFELFVGVVGPIGSCVPMPKPGVFGAAGGRDPSSKSKVSSLMICNESSNDMLVVYVIDVSDNDCNVNKMSDRMSDFCCVSTLSAVSKNVVARAVEVFAYGDFLRSKSRT